MTQENTGETKPVAGQPEEGEPVKAESAPEELAQLRAELDETRRARDEARQEALHHQRNVSKKDAELKQYKDTLTRIDNLDQKLNLLAEAITSREDSDDEEVEVKPRRKSNEVATKFKEIDQRNKSSAVEEARQRAVAMASEADALIRPTGLNMAQSPELRTAYALFRAGDFDEALEETKKVVNAMTEAKKQTAKTETPEEMEKRIREDERKKVYQEKGWNISDTGGGNSGGGKGLTVEAIRKMTPQELIANAKEIAKMPLGL